VSKNERIGVVLLQLGGPDSLDAVRPFLENLFADPDIIDFPMAFLFRRRLARIISSRRAPHVAEYYRKIGGRSPLRKLTARQEAALAGALRPLCDAVVVTAMRYAYPSTAEAVDRLQAAGVDRIVLLPLYPHYSKSTTGSSVNEWNRELRRRKRIAWKTDLVESYCDHPLYISALVRNIGIALRRVPSADRPRVNLLFSAHGTPMSLVRSGDPYQPQIVQTYEAVLASGNFGLEHHLCYQSKVGPARWLEPSLDQTVDRLAADGVSHVITVPIAFVSDHSETLYEINIQTRARAKEKGIRYFDMSPALHTNPDFIGALRDLVLEKVRQ
jgi:protoporphyrin/coproporphyrin ferrochelatase